MYVQRKKIETCCAYVSEGTEMWFVTDGQDRNLEMIHLNLFLNSISNTEYNIFFFIFLTKELLQETIYKQFINFLYVS